MVGSRAVLLSVGLVVGLVACSGQTRGEPNRLVPAPAPQRPSEPTPPPPPAESELRSQIAGQNGFFAPGPTGPDFTVKMDVTHCCYGGGVFPYALRRHGNWVRIDKVLRGAPSTDYVNLADGLVLNLTRGEDGGYASLSLTWVGVERHAHVDHRSRPTERYETVAGERCRVWEVYRLVFRQPGPRGSTRFGCVTPDGIEVRRWSDSTATEEGAAIATAVSRARVAPAAVRPPADLLDLTSWVDTGRPRNPTDDVEVVLEMPGAPPPLAAGAAAPQPRRMVVRRRGALLYRDTPSVVGGNVINVREIDGTFSLMLRLGPNERSLVLRRAPAGSTGSDPFRKPMDRPAETVAGETCRWVDLMAGVQDAGQIECLTDDGVALIVTNFTWGHAATYRAVRIRRGPLALDDVLPPHRMMRLAVGSLAR